VRGDLRVNTTFLFINIPVSNDLRRGEVNIPISFPYYFVLMLIFASVF
jgi:hypothetical protein